MLDTHDTGDLTPSATCAKELLEGYHHLGIPHFQRGLVWNDDAVALLLKSLYLRTPCGNIILWQPRDPAGHGVPLFEDGFRYLIIDGQQRIRSLYDALNPLSGELDGTGYQWYLNLAADPSFAGLFDGATRFGLFVRARTRTSDQKRRYSSLVPIAPLLRDGDAGIEEAATFLQLDNTAEARPAAILATVRGQLLAMVLHKVFACVVLHEENGRYGLAEVIDIYNRINSAGRRVESEERAYASLVGVSRSTHGRLEAFFRAVHPDQNRNTGMVRDDALQRRRESAFGFRLYMRTLVQVCNYHMGRSQGANALSFDLFDSHDILLQLRGDGAKTEELLDITHSVLTTVHEVVTQGLGCDDLQMLPDTACLIPVIELLVRFPQLSEVQYRRLLAYLVLRLVAEPAATQDATMRLTLLVDRSHTAGECCQRLYGELHWGETKKAALGRRLVDANTLRDRYVLLLYWQVRRHGARDFCYAENLVPETATALYSRFSGHEASVCKAASPEKQHIVPVSKLKDAFGIDERIRNARHLANNVGNLTYISQALNGLDGLSNALARLGEEPEENLRRHFVDNQALALYHVCGTAKGDALKKNLREFCEHRRRLIQTDLEAWMEELRPALLESATERIEPKARIFALDQGDYVRRLSFPDSVEDALLSMLSRSVLIPRSLERKPRFFLGHKRMKPAEVVLFPGDRIEIEGKQGAPQMDLLRRLATDAGLSPVSDCPGCHAKHNPPRWVLPVTAPATTTILCELARLAKPAATDSQPA